MMSDDLKIKNEKLKMKMHASGIMIRLMCHKPCKRFEDSIDKV
jgi:hypothetical protein